MSLPKSRLSAVIDYPKVAYLATVIQFFALAQ